MRKSILGAAVAVLALALAGVALAQFRQSARVAFTTHKAGQTTGVTADVRSSDVTAPFSKPKRATELVMAFPARTRFNLRTPLVSTCTLTDKQLTTPFGPRCPRSSQIGTGSAVVNAMPMAAKPAINAKAKAFVHSGNSIIITLLNDQKQLPGTPPIIIHATVSGSVLTVKLPHVVYGKSRKQKFPGVTLVIMSVKLNVPARGSGSNALITSGSCKSHKFVVTSHFTYADHSKTVVSSQSRCS